MSGNHDGKPSVLTFSRDPALQTTRTLLLRHAGFFVVGAGNLPEFRARVLSQPFDLILVCQSITGEDCEAACRFAGEYAPASRLLLMFTRLGKCVPEETDVLLDAQAGPKVFLETAQRMISCAAGRSL